MQESGNQLSGGANPVSIRVISAAAKLNRLTERAVDTDGNGRPDRLDITAHLDVQEAGKYELDVELRETSAMKSVSATLGIGPGEITVSFNGLELSEGMKVDGPYHVAVLRLGRVTDHQTLGVADLRNGKTLTTLAYKRSDWDRGAFYGTTKISGAGVDIKDDFEPIPTEFRVQPESGEAKLQAGGMQVQFLIRFERIGSFKDPIALRLSGVPSTIKAWPVNPDTFDLRRIVFYAGAVTKAGEYPIQVVAVGGGKKHSFPLRLVVEAPVTSAASRLIAGPPSTPETKLAAPKSVMLLLGANSSLGGIGCKATKVLAQRFQEGLRPGVDGLGMIEFATSVNIAMPLTVDFKGASKKVADDFARVQCAGFSSTAYALEKAREQLNRESAKNTERVVVMVFSIRPTAIAAKWPVRTQADTRQGLYGPEAVIRPSRCSDSHGRRYPEPGWATGDSMPDRIGALGGGQLNWINGPLAPVEDSLVNPAPTAADPDHGACGFSAPIPRPLAEDVAHLPEKDLGGVPLDGPRHLVRFTSGAYKGKMRPDSVENRFAALSNLFDRVIQALLDDGIRVIGLYGSSDHNPVGLESVFNMSETPAFNAAKPAGMLVAIHDEEQILPMLERVWEALGLRAARSRESALRFAKHNFRADLVSPIHCF